MQLLRARLFALSPAKADGVASGIMPAAEFPMSFVPHHAATFRFGHRFRVRLITSTTLRIYCSSAMPSIASGESPLGAEVRGQFAKQLERAVDSIRPGAAGPGLPRRLGRE